MRQGPNDPWLPIALAVDAGVAIEPREHEYSTIRTAVEELSPQEAARRLEYSIFPHLSSGHGDGGPDGLDHLERNCWRLTTERSFGSFYADGEWPMFYLSAPEDLQRVWTEIRDLNPLVSAGQPYYRGALALYEQEILNMKTGFQQVPCLVLFRILDKRARFQQLTFADDELRIPVEVAESCSLQMTWRTQEDDHSWTHEFIPVRPDVHGVVRRPFTNLPAEFWAVLSSTDGELLDRCGWAPGSGSKPGNPDLNLVNEAISMGEGARIEFKRQLGKGSNEEFAESVAAFANSGGGYIFLGIDDHANIIGFDPDHVQDTITQIVRATVAEYIEVRTNRVLVESKPIWIVEVPDGTEKPYRSADKVMVRAGGTDRVATTAEHRRLCSTGAENPNLPQFVARYI